MRWSGPLKLAGGAPQARREILRLRRAATASRGPLNADVRWLVNLSVFTALLTIVAATFLARAMDQTTECNATTSCTVEGTLRIFPGVPYAAAHIEGPGRCYIVALPDPVLKQWRTWNDVQVTVTADALIRGGEAEGIASLQYRDRWVATSGACPNSQVVLYVTSVETL